MAETTVSKLVSDGFWEVVQPLLPPEPPRPKGGRPRMSDRAVLAGIIYVLKTGIPWNMLLREIGCGSGVTWAKPFAGGGCGIGRRPESGSGC